MTEPLPLLDWIVKAAEQALDGPRNVTLADATIADLLERTRAELQKPREARIVGYECVMLLEAIRRVQWARAEHDPDSETRWTMIARAPFVFIKTDLALAKTRAPAS